LVGPAGPGRTFVPRVTDFHFCTLDRAELTLICRRMGLRPAALPEKETGLSALEAPVQRDPEMPN
jgi:hypothetical protein